MNQRGFTLVETAVVLVIIGLILGGILGSRSLIRSMQAKDVIAIVEDLRAATAYFKQRHSYLPGDWPYTPGEIPNITAGPGNGNGEIATAEMEAASLQLFHAGFLGKIDNSDPLDPSPRIRTLYGAVHLVRPADCGVAGFPTSARNVIEFLNLPCDIVAEVDNKIDDGNPVITTGRAFGAACNANDIVTNYAVTLE
ncbi:MAG: prepilin-type N-terminal cleavage/methylation domain-containing protein [Pseudomonadota bacterium]